MVARRLCLFSLFPLAACMLPPNVAILLPDENGEIGKARISNPGGTVALDKPYSTVGAAPAGGFGKAFPANTAQVEYEFQGVLSATPRPPVKFILYFLTGQAILDPDSAMALESAIAKARSTRNGDISVVGHADATGSESVNIKISSQRAAAIQEALVRAGLPASIIEVTSHGSKNPLVPTEPNIPEARNRRVEITIR